MAKIKITGESNYTLHGFIDFKPCSDKKCHNQSTFEESCYDMHDQLTDPDKLNRTKIELDAFRGI